MALSASYVPAPMLARVTNTSSVLSKPCPIFKALKTRVICHASHQQVATQQQRAQWDFTKYINTEERTQFGVEQLRFLARKRRYKAGEGPAMPEESTCPNCAGSGMTICHACQGTAVNEKDIEEIMGNELENILIADNGVVNVFWFLQKGGPCWYCRGDPNCPCRDCEGTGITGFRSINYNGD